VNLYWSKGPVRTVTQLSPLLVCLIMHHFDQPSLRRRIALKQSPPAFFDRKFLPARSSANFQELKPAKKYPNHEAFSEQFACV
jgi:hypothetical protein